MDRNEQEDDYRIKEEYDMQALECISGTGKLNIANVSWDPVHFGERDSEDFKVDMEPHRIFEWCTRFDEHSDCCRGECPRDLDGSDESVSSVKSDSYDSENEDDDEPDWIVKEEGGFLRNMMIRTWY